MRGCPAFGHVLLYPRVGGVEGGEDAPVVVGGVAVPGDAGYVAGSRIQDCLGVAGYVWRMSQYILGLVLWEVVDLPVL